MYEIIKINDHDHYIDMPAKAGIVTYGDGACLIDSGNDKDAAKKILKGINENGWKLEWIFNTHSHADHIGGNRTIQDRISCSIFVPGLEKSIAENPYFEPLMLYGGKPLPKLQNKFLMAKPSAMSDFPDESILEMIPLPGHSPDMTGYITRDRTAYIGDCITSGEILDKYGLSYMFDIGAALESIEKLKSVDARFFVPSHAPITDDITDLCEYNRFKIVEAAERIQSFLDEPLSFEQVLKKVFDSYGMELTLQQYALIGSTVRAYLGWLEEKGEAKYFFEDNMMYWRKK